MDEPTPTVDAPSRPRPRFRRTRIAVSVLFGVVTFALAAVWVRSYWWADSVFVPLPCDYQLEVDAFFGTVQFDVKWLPTLNWPHTFLKCDPITVSWRDVPHIPPFWFDATGGEPFVRLPYWFVVTISISASLTTMFSSGHFWRFSLRTMLIATTLVAVVLGLGVWALR